MKKSDRIMIYNKCDGHCAYCGSEITLAQMHVDHVRPVIRQSFHKSGKGYVKTGKMWNEGNDTIGNMLPACASCNLWKHSMDLEQFRESVRTQIDKIQKISCGFRLLLRYGIVSVNQPPDLFYFEKMQLEGHGSNCTVGSTLTPDPKSPNKREGATK